MNDIPFSDLTLILKDETDEITLKVHRIVLYLLSPYFKALLSTYRENTLDIITINVPNVTAASYLIRSVYQFQPDQPDQPDQLDWQLHLQLLRCRDYFGMKSNYQALCQTNIPDAGFDLLCQTVLPIQDIKLAVRILSKHLTVQSNVTAIPPHLINPLYDKINQSQMLLINHRSDQIMLVDPILSQIIWQIDNMRYNGMRIHCGKRTLAMSLVGNGIEIYSLDDGNRLALLKDTGNSSNLFYYTDNGSKLVSLAFNHMKIWDTTTYECIKNVTNIPYPYKILSWPNSEKILLFNSDKYSCRIVLRDLETTDEFYSKVLPPHVWKMRLSFDRAIIAVIEETHHVTFYRTVDGKELHTLSLAFLADITACRFGKCSNQIAFSNNKGIVLIYHVEQKRICFEKRLLNSNAISHVHFTLNDLYLFVQQQTQITVLDSINGNIVNRFELNKDDELYGMISDYYDPLIIRKLALAKKLTNS